MPGGTTFHFVTDGIESALELAREAAGELPSRSRAGRHGAPVPRGRPGRRAAAARRADRRVIGEGLRVFDGVQDGGRGSRLVAHHAGGHPRDAPPEAIQGVSSTSP